MMLPVTAAAVLSLAAAATGLSCPDQFEDLGLGEQRCYYFSDAADTQSWTGAFTQCVTLAPGGNLLSVPDPLHYYPVSYRVLHMGDAGVWTGLLHIGDQLTWSDDTPYNPQLNQFVVTASWSKAMYDAVVGLFVEEGASDIYGYTSAEDGKLHFVDGGVKKPYICTVDVAAPITTAASTTPAAPTTPTVPPVPCNQPWVENGGRCYLFSSEEKKWSVAAHGCHQQSDGEMVAIPDSSLLLYLLLQSAGERYWIGLQEENGTFLWEDGSDASGVSSQLGQYLDPWQPGRNCVLMDSGSYPKALIHADCFEENKYVCYTDVNMTSLFF